MRWIGVHGCFSFYINGARLWSQAPYPGSPFSPTPTYRLWTWLAGLRHSLISGIHPQHDIHSLPLLPTHHLLSPQLFSNISKPFPSAPCPVVASQEPNPRSLRTPIYTAQPTLNIYSKAPVQFLSQCQCTPHHRKIRFCRIPGKCKKVKCETSATEGVVHSACHWDYQPRGKFC